LVDGRLTLPAVHRDHQRAAEAQVAQGAALRDGRLPSDPVPVDEAFPEVLVHGEVADLERGEVLEEVAALRRGHAEVAKPGLHDRARAGDLLPGDGNPEPRIVRAPASDADQ